MACSLVSYLSRVARINVTEQVPASESRHAATPPDAAKTHQVFRIHPAPAKTINFWKRAVFIPKKWCFFRLLEVFLCFGGGVLCFWRCFCAFCVFFSRASARNFLGSLFFEGRPHRNGEFPLCTRGKPASPPVESRLNGAHSRTSRSSRWKTAA